MRTSDPFLKDRTAERALTATHSRAVTAVMKLKQRHTMSKGSALARTRTVGRVGGRESSPPASASLAIGTFAISPSSWIRLGFEMWIHQSVPELLPGSGALLSSAVLE